MKASTVWAADLHKPDGNAFLQLLQLCGYSKKESLVAQWPFRILFGVTVILGGRDGSRFLMEKNPGL